MQRRLRLLHSARRLLADSTQKGQRHCALACFGNRIIAIGFNSYVRTHPVQSSFARRTGNHNRNYLHAEIDALLRSRGFADTLVIVRVNKGGDFMGSKPCRICQLAIKTYGIKKIIHS